jgi:hypothetical protein
MSGMISRTGEGEFWMQMPGRSSARFIDRSGQSALFDIL